MLFLLKKLVQGVAPAMLLVIVIAALFRMVQSGPAMADRATAVPEPATAGPESETPGPAATQSVLIEAKAVSPVDSLPEASQETVQESPQVQPQSFSAASDSTENKKNEVWLEIDDAISGLNELVGVEMFLDVKRGEKGQMEVLLDNSFWKRVRYQTRVDLKTDISNLWHLYVTEYGYAGNSVVYFIDESDGSVIDIFSRSN